MLATQPRPLSGHELIQGGHRSSRRPLQPKNLLTTTTTDHVKLKPNPSAAAESRIDNSNKENLPPVPVKREFSPTDDDTFDGELNAVIREEKLRSEKIKNEKMLRERGLMLDLEMKEIINRGELQNHLEIEVDRLYRLKEIRLASMRISRLRSLRDKEEEKKMKQEQLNKARFQIPDRAEQKVDESQSQIQSLKANPQN